MKTEPGGRRRRSVGAKAGIGVDAIVAAAQTLPIEQLSMQAVARILGVDRTALNHHVATRNELIRIVAHAAFVDGFSYPGSDGSWEDKSRQFAHAYADALVFTGSLAAHVTEDLRATRFLEATESLLAALVDAGFPLEYSVRHVVALGHLARGHARDRVDVADPARPTRPETAQQALTERQRSRFPLLDQVSSQPVDTYSPMQLDVSLDAFVRGASAWLADRA